MRFETYKGFQLRMTDESVSFTCTNGGVMSLTIIKDDQEGEEKAKKLLMAIIDMSL